jgi:DNA topoisomerase-1
MFKYLIIVESPKKVNTIQQYLDDQYLVKSTIGHVQDLYKNKLSIDIDNNFYPEYKILYGKNKILNEFQNIKKNNIDILLALDNDREGEFIA